METIIVMLLLGAAFALDIYLGRKAVETISFGWLVAHILCTVASVVAAILAIVYVVVGGLT